LGAEQVNRWYELIAGELLERAVQEDLQEGCSGAKECGENKRHLVLESITARTLAAWWPKFLELPDPQIPASE
jgi:hypothetical protein